jgi:hypothetical protein
MTSIKNESVWVGDDAIQYLKESFLLQNKVDALILHAADDRDTALAFALELQQIWEHLAVPHLEKIQAVKDAKKAPAEDEGIDVIDYCNWELKGYFPILPTDCEKCSKSPPKPKIVVLDTSSLLRSEFLEELYGQVLFERALLLPLITTAFLSQPDCVIRSYYLKLSVRGTNEHVLPIVPKPINLPNYLFDHVNPIRLFKCNKWMQDLPGMYNYVKERLKGRMIDMFAKKLQRRGRECCHSK